MNDFKIYAAPLQGYTEATWRRYHSEVSGGVDAYFAPFLRIEKGVPRERDLRDMISPLNQGINVIPQIIFGTIEEFRLLLRTVADLGFRHIDLNAGCPHPPQTNHGRGAAAIANLELLEAVAKETMHSDMEFSLKMRLGQNQRDEWIKAMPLINRMRLSHVTVHPRIARQQYRGNVDMDAFAGIYNSCSHPVIFNGDLKSASEISGLRHVFPDLAGVMLGRGLLGRPCLAAEWRDGRIRTGAEAVRALTGIHNAVFSYLSGRLCGDSQLLMKIKPYWDFAEDTIGRKALKAIKKSTTIAAYSGAIGGIGSDMDRN